MGSWHCLLTNCAIFTSIMPAKPSKTGIPPKQSLDRQTQWQCFVCMGVWAATQRNMEQQLIWTELRALELSRIPEEKTHGHRQTRPSHGTTELWEQNHLPIQHVSSSSGFYTSQLKHRGRKTLRASCWVWVSSVSLDRYCDAPYTR